MSLDSYYRFRQGKLTQLDALRDVITEVGAGVYTYMIMLQQDERNHEADFFFNIRAQIFDIRDRLVEGVSQETLDILSHKMHLVSRELDTAQIFLRSHRFKESLVLQSVTNTACGLVSIIKHFYQPVK